MTTEADKILEEYKFKKIGNFHIDKNNFIVDYEEQFGEMDQCIYIHVIDNKIVRVGSSKNKLKSRMKSWERDVSKALNGQEDVSTKIKTKIRCLVDGPPTPKERANFKEIINYGDRCIVDKIHKLNNGKEIYEINKGLKFG